MYNEQKLGGAEEGGCMYNEQKLGGAEEGGCMNSTTEAGWSRRRRLHVQ